MRRRKSFAAIELLVDLALVAILIGMLIPFYNFNERLAYERIARREIRMLKVAVISYYENSSPNRYPPRTANLCAEYLLSAKPQIIKRILPDPFSVKKEEYHYTISANGKFYCIWTIGRDKKSGILDIDNSGNIIKDKKCDEIYATHAIDP